MGRVFGPPLDIKLKASICLMNNDSSAAVGHSGYWPRLTESENLASGFSAVLRCFLSVVPNFLRSAGGSASKGSRGVGEGRLIRFPEPSALPLEPDEPRCLLAVFIQQMAVHFSDPDPSVFVT